MVNLSRICRDSDLTMGSPGALVDVCGRPLTANISSVDVYPTDQPTRYLGQGIYPLLLALSIVGNLFCIWRFMREKRKRSAIVYLVTLCTANIFVMLLDLPGYIGTYYLSVREKESYIDLMEDGLGFLIWSQQSFILISNWTLIVYTVEKILLAVKLPFFPLRIRLRQAVTVSILLIIISALISIPDFIFYNRWWNRTQTSSPEGACDVTAPMLCHWMDKWSRVQRSLQIFFFDLAVPLLTFIAMVATTTTLMIIRSRNKRRKNGQNGLPNEEELRMSRRRSHNKLLSTKSEGRSEPLNGAAADVPSTIQPLYGQTNHEEMLTRSLILYFVTHIPDIVYTFIVMLSNYPSCVFNLSSATLSMWQPLVHLIMLLNYSVNFLLYLDLLGNLRSIWQRKPRPVAERAAPHELVPLGTERKMVRFSDRTEGGVDVRLPQMRREKSSVLLPEVVGTILNSEMFRELWLFLPFRTRIYQPQLIFSTSEDGTSISNFLNTVRGNGATIMAVRTMKGETFGAYCGSSWDERVLGKREYLFFGTGETFLFVFNPDLRLYPWIGMCGRKTSPDSCLFMAADSHHISIGGGGEEAISFESSLARGFSGPSLTFNNPSLCENGEFESAIVEVYTFTDTML